VFHTPKHKLLTGSIAVKDLAAISAAGVLARIYERAKRTETPFSDMVFTTDEMFTLDSQLVQQFGAGAPTTDSTGVFLVSQLEQLDRIINKPLYSVTWSRDVDLRTDVSMGTELASWTLSNMAAPGGVTPSGINWISSNSNAIPGPAVDLGKTAQPLHPWGQELSFSVFEMAKSLLLGEGIDMQKYDAMDTKYQMDIDQVVYTGEAAFAQYGLLNSPNIVASNVPNGGAGSPLWVNKTPQERLNDVNAILNAAWLASAYSVMPDRLLLPPLQFLGLNATIVTNAGSSSVLQFLRDNNASNAINGRPLTILPQKWLVGRGAGGTDRMVAYTKDPKFIRYPMVPRQRTPLELRSIYQLTTYYAKLGFCEWRYVETAQYADGI
jgi:hypothetical protein